MVEQMSQSLESLTIATQGDEYSYHAVAAQLAAEPMKAVIDAKKRFGDVVRASRSTVPGLGVIAIRTVAGTVEESAKEIMVVRPSALPPIVARVDVQPKLALIGVVGVDDLEKLDRQKPRVTCIAQKPAWLQCREFIGEHLPFMEHEFRAESTAAIREVIQRGDNDFVAIGPTFAAEPLGGVVIGPEQINPTDSVTSFYVLQRDPRQQLLPPDPTKTSVRTIISLAHPEGHGERNKCIEQAISDGIEIARFIPYRIGDVTKHNNGLRRSGGLLEVEHGRYDERVTDFCARVNTLCANDGVEGPFGTKILGEYNWYPEEPLDPEILIEAPFEEHTAAQDHSS